MRGSALYLKDRAEGLGHETRVLSAVNADQTIDVMCEVSDWPKSSFARIEGNYLAIFSDVEDAKIHTLPSGIRVWLRFTMLDRRTNVRVSYFAAGRGGSVLELKPRVPANVFELFASGLEALEQLWHSKMRPERVAFLLRYRPEWVSQDKAVRVPSLKRPKPEDIDF